MLPIGFVAQTLLLTAVLLLAPPAFCEEGGAPKESPPANAAFSATIKAEIARLQQADEADTDAARALKLNRQALGILQQASQDTRQTAAFRETIDSAADREKTLRQDLEAVPDGTGVLGAAQAAWEEADLDALSAELIQHQAKLAQMQSEVSDRSSQLERLQTRPEQRGAELAQGKSRLATLREQLRSAQPVDSGDVLTRARNAVLQSEVNALKAHVEMLGLEGVSEPVRKRLLKLEDQAARATLALEQGLLDALKARIGDLRQQDADQARKRTAKTQVDLADEPPLLKTTADENAAIGRQLSEVIEKKEQSDKVMARERRRLVIIETTLQRITLQLRIADREKSVGRYLFTQRDRLLRFLDEQVYQSEVDTQHEDLGNAHLAQIEVEDALSRVQDPARAVADIISANREQQAWNALPPAEQERIRTVLSQLLSERAKLAATLSQHYGDYIKSLNELMLLEQQVLDKGTTLRELIEQNLWFLPSNEPLGDPWFSGMTPTLAWFGDPQSWLGALRSVIERWLAVPWLAGPMLLLILALLVARGWLRRRLSLIAANVGHPIKDRFSLTLEALLITAAMSSARPLLAVSAGMALVVDAGNNADDFAVILGHGLNWLAFYWFTLLFLSNTLRENGLAQVHFGWRHRVLDVVRRNLRWYVPISVLLLLVTAMTRLHWLATGAGFNDDHLGRSAFVLMIAVLTLFFWRVLDPRQYIDRERRGEHSLWWPTWALMGLIAMIQTALIAAALAGYYYTALYLFRIFFNSALVVIGVYLLYALALRWFMLARRHLDYRRQQLRVLEDAENRANKAAADQAGEALAQTEKGRTVDLREVSSRVQKFLRVLLGLGIVFGLAWVGQELVPLLGTVEQVTLWQHQSGEGANAVVVGVTMADLLIALAIAALTLTAARNLPGMVEVVYLERVGMKSGNRYAFTQILRYAIYVGGILWTLSAIGVGWGDVQWLVAAMGVGLGFGLKEIFGNFVSGLILLFERPIRMGDTITVGDVTGVVARIRIRATTITDWDNKELVVPNQKLITDSLVNWTLSNPITRLTFRIGVAYGSDPEEVHRIILESVQSNVLALQDPTPSVFFIGFGENALEFEIRVFVQERVQRMPLTHELNIALNKALTEQGIEIPLPQRDLHLRELTPGVLKTGTGGEGQG